MKNYPYLCYVEIDDAANQGNRRQMKMVERSEVGCFFIKNFIFHDSKN